MNSLTQFAQNHFKLVVAAILLIAVVASFSAMYVFSGQDQVSANQACEVDICVDITENGMQPGEIAVKTGQYAQFNTKDDRSHSLSLGNGTSHGEKSHDEDTADSEADSHDSDHSHEHLGSLQSGKFGPGEGWKVQFTEPGTFVIHDHNYPENSILVVVYNEKQ